MEQQLRLTEAESGFHYAPMPALAAQHDWWSAQLQTLRLMIEVCAKDGFTSRLEQLFARLRSSAPEVAEQISRQY